MVNAAQCEVVVVEHQLIVRRGVELLLRDEGFRVVGLASQLEEARALLGRRRRDVVLLAVRLAMENTVGLVEELLYADPDMAIVLYTGYNFPPAELAVAAQSGARGFVLKTSPAARLIHALRGVASGGHYVDPALAALLGEDASPSPLPSPRPTLTAREREIFALLADGLTGAAVAAQLFLSPETVRTHVRNATTKLGARTRVQAVAMSVGRAGEDAAGGARVSSLEPELRSRAA